MLGKVVGNDPHHGPRRDPVAQGGHIDRTHPDATEACRTAEQIFLRGAVDINSTVIGIPVSGFGSFQPEDPRDDGIPPGGVRLEDFAGGPP